MRDLLRVGQRSVWRADADGRKRLLPGSELKTVVTGDTLWVVVEGTHTLSVLFSAHPETALLITTRWGSPSDTTLVPMVYQK